jgi:CRISPR-associated protein Cas8a1/Csx13
MVSDQTTMPDGPEATLVRACHEAWRRRARELGDRARDSGASFDRLYEREYERMRISFARCKNAAMVRQALTDFWSRGATRSGALPALQEGWTELLPLLSHRWQEARDLALLALASYKRKEDE